MRFRRIWVYTTCLSLIGSQLAFASGSARSPKAPAPTPAASPGTQQAQSTELANAATPQEIQALCKELKDSIKSLGWKVDPCSDIKWKSWGKSINDRPLIFAEFGDPHSLNTTLILSMVHGDEITPLYLALQLAHWMRENSGKVGDARVVIAPLVNPDSFFVKPRTRTNAKGVDVNRNFPTKDWEKSALQSWKTKFKSNPRRYPGPEPSSEPETKFQEFLIKSVRPQKILSIHAPLNFMDYDGPNLLTLDKFPREYVQECLKLRSRLKAVPGGFFPGSLGNYAGQEMGIPTLTLELPSSDPRKADKFWNHFKSGIRSMIEFKMPEYASL